MKLIVTATVNGKIITSPKFSVAGKAPPPAVADDLARSVGSYNHECACIRSVYGD